MSLINEGDIVMLVRGHQCALSEFGGVPWRVVRVVPQTGEGWECPACGERNIAKGEMWGASGLPASRAGSSLPLPWLKKLEPGLEPTDISAELDAERKRVAV